jgi:hypothetical protein
MLGAALGADGSFGVYLRPPWLGTRWRVRLVGPNYGRWLAPDAAATLEAPG